MRKLSIYLLSIIIILSIGLLGGCGTQNTSTSSVQPNQQQEEKQEAKQTEGEKKEELFISNAESYKQYLVVHDIKISDYSNKTFSDDFYVNGQIKNNGDKTIKNLFVIVYYLDENGEAISEDTSVCIVEDGSNLIKPNYESEFIFKVPKMIIESWDKKVKVEIRGIEFES